MLRAVATKADGTKLLLLAQEVVTDPLKVVVAYVNKFWQLSNAEFDTIVEGRFGIDHDDEALIAALIEEGWTYTPFCDGDTRYQRWEPDRTTWYLLRHPEV